MSALVDKELLYSLVRKRLGPDATVEMIDSIHRQVEALLFDDRNSSGSADQEIDATGTRMILTATGIDSPNAAEDVMVQLQSYKCQVLGADRSTADGYFSLLVSLDIDGCALSLSELSAALQVTAAADSLEISLTPAPPKQ